MLKKRHARDGEIIRIVAVTSEEQTSRIHAAIAHRAFEIYRLHGSNVRNELEDWRTAERELLCKLCFGRTTFGEKLWIGTDASRFCEGTIGIWVAAHQLTIFGTPYTANEPAEPCDKGKPVVDTIFRVIPLDHEIDPVTVNARIRGTALEITAIRVHQNAEKELQAA